MIFRFIPLFLPVNLRSSAVNLRSSRVNVRPLDVNLRRSRVNVVRSLVNARRQYLCPFVCVLFVLFKKVLLSALFLCRAAFIRLTLRICGQIGYYYLNTPVL